MKKSTCQNLGGSCEVVITGKTPEEMGENCRKHVMEMVQSEDESHAKAIEAWKTKSPEEMQKWYEDFVNTFEKQEDA